MDFEDWLVSQNDEYYIQTGNELDNEQIEWMEAIYEEYADEDGYIDWEDHDPDSAWWIYMEEVIGLDYEDVEKYA